MSDLTINQLKAHLQAAVEALERTAESLKSAADHNEQAAGIMAFALEGTRNQDVMDVRALAYRVMEDTHLRVADIRHIQDGLKKYVNNL